MYRDLLQTLGAYSLRGGHLDRFGNPGDGGYIMLDDFSHIFIAISCGIKDDVSWDMAMARKGLTVYQYDPTVSLPPGYPTKFSFHKTGIHGGEDYVFMPRIAGLHYTTLSSVASEIPGFNKGATSSKLTLRALSAKPSLRREASCPS